MPRRKPSKSPPRLEPLRLNLGCGLRAAEGWTNVDARANAGVDVVCDLAQAPWPWPDNSVDEVQAFHLLEHLTGRQRCVFVNELWRVLKTGMRATIVVPYWSSMRAVQDPTHEWPPLCEASFLYFNRAWRDAQRLDGYLGLACNFGFTYGYVLPPETANRAEEARARLIANGVNTVHDLQVVLTKEE